jgi:hypothetical protein
MGKNYIWQALLLTIGCAALIYSGIAIYKYNRYSSLNTSTLDVKVTELKVVEKSSDAFYIEANYQFEVQGKPYQGAGILDERYRNPYAAKTGIKPLNENKWEVWYDREDPNHSSLQKEFPIKEWVSTVFLWGLFLYFLWLGFYVAGKTNR